MRKTIYNCDRCKKDITENWNRQEIITIEIEQKGFDLCLNCIKDLKEFLKNGPK